LETVIEIAAVTFLVVVAPGASAPADALAGAVAPGAAAATRLLAWVRDDTRATRRDTTHSRRREAASAVAVRAEAPAAPAVPPEPASPSVPVVVDTTWAPVPTE
jgi:hypothetical protein